MAARGQPCCPTVALGSDWGQSQAGGRKRAGQAKQESSRREDVGLVENAPW